jgi:DNA-binding response OmpR family regulator
MDGFLSKPLSLKLLNKYLKAILKRKQKSIKYFSNIYESPIQPSRQIPNASPTQQEIDHQYQANMSIKQPNATVH